MAKLETMADQLTTPPPPSKTFELSYPAGYVLLVTINREKAMNAIPIEEDALGDSIFRWFDKEPSLRVAIITGKGSKSFCAGADLIQQGKVRQDDQSGVSPTSPPPHTPDSGFAGLSRRLGKKPVIAAVNGFALGGRMEIALNCDMIIASPTATFGLSEAKRGLYAGAGGLPRVVRTFGMQLASEIVLADRRLTATEAEQHGFARVAHSPATVVEEAVKLAQAIAGCSPGAVIVSRAGLREAWETASVERVAQLTAQRFQESLLGSQNLQIGLAAFASKQKPQWVPSRL